VLDVLEHLLAFLLQPVDRRAGLRLDLLAQRLERALEVADLLLRLLVVVPEVLLEPWVVRLLLELFEHAEDGLLHRQRGAQLVDEELSRSLDLGHTDPFLVVDDFAFPARPASNGGFPLRAVSAAPDPPRSPARSRSSRAMTPASRSASRRGSTARRPGPRGAATRSGPSGPDRASGRRRPGRSPSRRAPRARSARGPRRRKAARRRAAGSLAAAAGKGPAPSSVGSRSASFRASARRRASSARPAVP